MNLKVIIDQLTIIEMFLIFFKVFMNVAVDVILFFSFMFEHVALMLNLSTNLTLTIFFNNSFC